MIRLLQWHKWRVFLQVLPFGILFCLIKYFFHLQGWEPWQFDAFTGALFGTSTFVVSLVLNGTLAEYRSSEGIPILIVSCLEEIQDCNRLFASINQSYDPNRLQSSLSLVAQSILGWLKGKQSLEMVYSSLEDLNLSYRNLAEQGGAVWTNRLQVKLGNIRLLVQQIKVSRDTDYLAPAYVLLLIFLSGSITALLLISSESFSENLTVAAFIFISFIYLLVLIRDLDNPFQYDGSSTVDVDLSILESACDRFLHQQT
ncbi:MAG: hypothetical protein SFT94_09955 [Pseudanabaenaceae cyanobacterium bins.68]|nr:hypothetical protein [Pseudanabaenaceae cyanobacterium bins.68]